MLACAHIGDYGAVDCLAVNGQALNALADVGGVLDGDVVNSASELSGSGEAVPFGGDGGIYLQAVVIGLDSENVL